MVESKHKYSTYVLLAIIGLVCIVMLVEGLEGFGNSGSVPKFIYGDVLGNSSIIDDLNGSIILTSSICTSINGLCNGSVNVSDNNNYPTNLSVTSLNGLNTITVGRSNLSDLIASYSTSLNYTSGFSVAPLQYFNENGLAGNLTNSGAVYNSTGGNYEFDGINDYLSFSPIIINITGTISVRFRQNNLIDNTIFNTIAGNNYNYIRTYVSPGNRTGIELQSTGTNYAFYHHGVPTNEWHNFVWQFQELNATHINISEYIDGIYYSSQYANNDILNISAIGGRYSYFNGSIDDVMIFNRSLSASEVLALNASGRGGEPGNKSGLVLWAPFSNFTAQSGIDTNLNNTGKSNIGINNYTLSPVCVNNFGVLQRC